MVFLYDLVLILLALVFLPVILLAFLIVPKFRAGFWQKMGFYKTPQNYYNKKTLWLHAVSVGELNAVANLIMKIKEQLPEYRLVLSTVTKTGQDIAVKRFNDVVDEIIYFPYDFSFSVRAALNKISPDIVLIAETEIWPQFVTQVSKRKIKLGIINGRISPSSYSNYKKIKMFLGRILKKYSFIYMQTQGDAHRIIDMGADDYKVRVMGNLKFDITRNVNSSDFENMKNNLKINDKRLIIAGSTHDGEEKIILNAFANLRNKFDDVRLMIAPRHPERFGAVESIVKNTGLKYGKKSENADFEENDVIILDTIGELAKMYALCHFAFIGGSFCEVGGHNPLEVIIFEKPVLSGPTVFNFKDVYEILQKENAALIVYDEELLLKKCELLLSDEEYYNSMTTNCKQIFENNSGAIDFVIDKLKEDEVN